MVQSNHVAKYYPQVKNNYFAYYSHCWELFLIMPGLTTEFVLSALNSVKSTRARRCQFDAIAYSCKLRYFYVIVINNVYSRVFMLLVAHELLTEIAEKTKYGSPHRTKGK